MKFNAKARGFRSTRNHEGAEAYALAPEMELYSAVVTASLNAKFYEGNDQFMARIRKLIAENEASFVAKLAVYARTEMGLRSIPIVLAVELAKIHNGDDLVSRTIARIVQRADEITELLAYYQTANARKGSKQLNRLSKQVQKGLAEAFNRFDEYQFAKYNRDTAVKFRDALFLVHPRPKDSIQQMLFDKITQGTLETPYTWEVELSRVGQQFKQTDLKDAALTQKWEELIESGKLGYMATLRNLRNILQADVSPDHLKQIADRLGDAHQVRKARQFPFRYLSAYRELATVNHPFTSMIMEALERAVLASTANIAGFGAETKVLIASDVSGSMTQPVSKRSKVQMYDIGLLLGALLQQKSAAVSTVIFGTTMKAVNLPRNQILANTLVMRDYSRQVGWATNGHLVIEHLLKHRIRMDKVMVFTDMQLWDSTGKGNSLSKLWHQYRERHPEARLYLFDLVGYGQAPLRIQEEGVHLIAGWNEKIFRVLEDIERGADALDNIRNTIL